VKKIVFSLPGNGWYVERDHVVVVRRAFSMPSLIFFGQRLRTVALLAQPYYVVTLLACKRSREDCKYM